MQRIVIVGGGFGGLTAAALLARARLPDTEITLVTEHPWVTYYGALYRLLRGKPVAQVCIPLSLIAPRSVRAVFDRAVSVDPVSKTVTGVAGTYGYDTLIVAAGSEPAFFNIEGMDEHALRMMTVRDTFDIRETVRRRVRAMRGASPERSRVLGRFAVIGGGATGVEISGELLPFARSIALNEGVDPAFIEVDLIEATETLFPPGGPVTSAKVLARLQSRSVNVRMLHAVASVHAEEVRFKDGAKLDAATVIWTAGAQASSLLAAIPGLERDKRGRGVVDEQLCAKGVEEVYLLGDCASTKYSGMAQTAVDDGTFVARVLIAKHTGVASPTYAPRAPAYALPAGGWWAAVKFGPIRTYGFTGYVLRRLADMHVYSLILPWQYVLPAFFGWINLRRHGVELDGGEK